MCEITGVTHLFGDEAGLLQAVDKLLASRKIIGTMAIADSVGAAWAVAHYANSGGRGSARAKDFGAAGALPAHIIPPGETRQAIETLPVESLRIGEETVATLSRLGVHFIGQLLRLPRAGLAPRLGKSLVRRIEQALGEVDEPIAVYRRQPSTRLRIDWSMRPVTKQSLATESSDWSKRSGRGWQLVIVGHYE